MSEDNDAFQEFEMRILKKLYVWLVVGGIAIGGVGGSGVLRVDKFGQSDYELREEKQWEAITKYVDREVHHAKQNIESKMPPYATRRRIKEVELYLERSDPTFRVPTQEW